jgi:DNA-binding NarL/FixJ family response regulator
VEDHTLIGQILANVLRGLAGIGEVTLTTSVGEAIAAAAELDADLLIVDLALPDGHGLNALRAVLKWHPNVACVVLSARASEFTCPTEFSTNILAIVEKAAAFDTLRLEVEATCDVGSEDCRRPAVRLGPAAEPAAARPAFNAVHT